MTTTIDNAPGSAHAARALAWDFRLTDEKWTVRAPAGDHWLDHLRRSAAPGGHRVAVGDLMARLVTSVDTATLRLYSVLRTRGSTSAWLGNGYGYPYEIEITARLQLAAWCDYGQRGRFACDYYVPIQRLRGFAAFNKMSESLQHLAADYHAAATASREVTP